MIFLGPSLLERIFFLCVFLVVSHAQLDNVCVCVIPFYTFLIPNTFPVQAPESSSEGVTLAEIDDATTNVEMVFAPEKKNKKMGKLISVTTRPKKSAIPAVVQGK
jgi:hypothetical protein